MILKPTDHRRPGPTRGCDSESLNTDVMRFMAILGLCLTAIFSLVQSAPPQPAQAPHSPQAAAAPSQPSVGVTQAKPQTPAPIRSATQTPVIATAQAAAPKPERASTRQGFTLRFESAAALDRLLRGGGVRLYRMQAKQAREVRVGNHRPTLVVATFPRRFHQMAPTTVPEAYRQAWRHHQSGAKPAEVVWGVQLPAAMEQEIAKLIQGHRGGELVIGKQGRVTFGPSVGSGETR